MDILAYSDVPASFHDYKREDLDLILYLGDLTISDLPSWSIPIVGVYGNHDPLNPKFLDEDPELHNAHLEIVNIKGVNILGYEGALKYKPSGPRLWTEQDARRDLEPFLDKHIDIFITHSPPLSFGLNDEIHNGSHALEEFILKNQPKYHFCGHTHKSQSLTIGKTKAFNILGLERYKLHDFDQS